MVKSVKSNLKLTDNAKIVLERRYLKKDMSGNIIETPENLFLRVAKAIAEPEKKYNPSKFDYYFEKFYSLMSNLYFLPNSPTLMNAGRALGQLSACFVLPIEDSIPEIFQSLKDAAIIHKSGGGTGFSFSKIRPKGDVVRTTNGVASGPLSFLKVYDSATEEIKQGGTRRGANMGILRVDHPDIREFITVKQDTSKLTNFNLSVAITNVFMEALIQETEYDIIHPVTKEIVRTESAKEIFDLIVKSAWSTGEPGILFIDKINEKNKFIQAGLIESTNPCGEQPLLPYESCNLGSLNLSKMVQGQIIDYPKLRDTVRLAVRFLDNVIEVNKYPFEKIKKETLKLRKIGLGVMGFADMLYKLNIPYGSEDSFKLAEHIMKTIKEYADETSKELYKERGTSEFLEQYKIRNATTTTIAPTGTLSIIAGTSGGIEPVFALSFYKQILDNDKLLEVHPYFVKVLKENGIYSEERIDEIAETDGTIKNNDKYPKEIRDIFVVAGDLTPKQHIDIQAAFQKYTDNAVSKTINFPNSATVEEAREAYIYAYKRGLKGLTIYRDGSRPIQVLNKGKIKDDKKEPSVISQEQNTLVKARPETIRGVTTLVQTGCGKLYVTINFDEETGKPFEVFTQIGKAGGCASCQLESKSRLISLALRSNIPIENIVKQLRGIRCPQPTWHKGDQILSCSDAVARILGKYILLEEPETIEKDNTRNIVVKPVTVKLKEIERDEIMLVFCPDCGSNMIPESGCYVCKSCGLSKCN